MATFKLFLYAAGYLFNARVKIFYTEEDGSSYGEMQPFTEDDLNRLEELSRERQDNES